MSTKWYNIDNTSKRELLYKLWLKSEYNERLIVSENPPKFDLKTAKIGINNGYIEYISGKPLKIYINGNKIRSDYLINKYGENSILSIINSCRTY